jgi:hypothetical protein
MLLLIDLSKYELCPKGKIFYYEYEDNGTTLYYQNIGQFEI